MCRYGEFPAPVFLLQEHGEDVVLAPRPVPPSLNGEAGGLASGN